MIETLKKIQVARAKIRETKLKKEGKNEFAKYSYFTPEQVESLIAPVCQELGLFNKFDLVKNDGGLVASLTIYNLETGASAIFTIPTVIPEIKATNAAQQLGGTVTYSERYLKMIAYEIKDNELDFDSDKQTKQSVAPQVDILKIIAEVTESKDRQELTAIWNKYHNLQQNKRFADAVAKKSSELKAAQQPIEAPDKIEEPKSSDGVVLENALMDIKDITDMRGLDEVYKGYPQYHNNPIFNSAYQAKHKQLFTTKSK